MSAMSDLSSIEALITEGFAKKITDLRSKDAFIHKDIPFIKEEGQRLGSTFEFPLALTDETSVTYSNNNGEVIDYVIGGAAVYQRASASSVEMFVIGDLPFKATTANKGGVKQYFAGMKTKMENVGRTGVVRLEDSVVYGSTPRAVATGGANIGATGTTLTFVCDEDEWSPAMWLGKEGSLWDCYATTSSAAAVNATAALTLKVGGVDVATRTLLFTCHASDTAALDALSNGNLYPHGSKIDANEYNDMTGIVALLSSGASTIHGVSRDYSLWDTQTFDFEGTVSFSQLCDLVAERIPYGLSGKVKFHLSPKNWNKLMISEAAMVDHSGHKGEKFVNGANELAFKIQGIEVIPVANPLMKEGIALLLSQDSWERIGSTDLTFKIDGKETVYVLEGNNAIRTVLYSEQGLVCRRPGVNAYCYNLI